MGSEGGGVDALGAHEVSEIVGVLCEAFRDYPVMRFVLGDEADDEARLSELVHFFVMARVVRGEPLLGVREGGGLQGVALVSFPERESPEEMLQLRDAVWARLGLAARTRYERFGDAARPLTVEEPHIHLNMIGVRETARGQGVGRNLLERVHALSLEEESSRGVTLTTEDPANVPLYEHLGYEVVGRAQVAPGLETWGMFRPDRGG